MAAEALTKAGEKLGLPTKVETNGSDGAKNVLTRKEIEACGGIFVFPVVDHALLYCVALAVGSVVGAVILSLLKKNRADA